jgi:hypothetical protein
MSLSGWYSLSLSSLLSLLAEGNVFAVRKALLGWLDAGEMLLFWLDACEALFCWLDACATSLSASEENTVHAAHLRAGVCSEGMASGTIRHAHSRLLDWAGRGGHGEEVGARPQEVRRDESERHLTYETTPGIRQYPRC